MCSHGIITTSTPLLVAEDVKVEETVGTMVAATKQEDNTFDRQTRAWEEESQLAENHTVQHSYQMLAARQAVGALPQALYGRVRVLNSGVVSQADPPHATPDRYTLP